MGERCPFIKIYGKPELQSSSLIVGWDEDAGRLGTKVTDCLNKKLGCDEFGEIEPAGFFPIDGVLVEDDIAQFPESKFYCCNKENLVFFKSTPPRAEWYKFLNSVLDVAEHYCHVRELYTIGAMITSRPHTIPRELLAMVNSSKMKKMLSQYNIATDTEYETPHGQRPTLSSLLLWVAKRRNIPGVGLWVPIPFYLASTEDPQAWRRAIGFFDERFNLGIDFRDIDEEVIRQNKKLTELANQFPEFNEYVRRLEWNLSLTENESEKLTETTEEFLKKRD